MAERWVLTAEAWWMHGLRCDAEAEAWLNRASGDGYGGAEYRALFGALVDEGVVDLFVFGRAFKPLFYAQDDHHIEVVTIRRRYRGPVPPQVLAAFQPENRTERVWFFT